MLIVRDCMVYPEPELKELPIFFSEAEGWYFLSYVITQDIWNKFIKKTFCFGCMVWPWLFLFQDWTFVKYWWDCCFYFLGLYFQSDEWCKRTTFQSVPICFGYIFSVCRMGTNTAHYGKWLLSGKMLVSFIKWWATTTPCCWMPFGHC